jgi:hypothetical protein
MHPQPSWPDLDALSDALLRTSQGSLPFAPAYRIRPGDDRG